MFHMEHDGLRFVVKLGEGRTRHMSVIPLKFFHIKQFRRAHPVLYLLKQLPAQRILE